MLFQGFVVLVFLLHHLVVVQNITVSPHQTLSVSNWQCWPWLTRYIYFSIIKGSKSDVKFHTSQKTHPEKEHCFYKALYPLLLQSVLPFFVATKMTRIRKPTFDKPTPERYVAAELATVGLQSQTNGYFPHAVMVRSEIIFITCFSYSVFKVNKPCCIDSKRFNL